MMLIHGFEPRRDAAGDMVKLVEHQLAPKEAMPGDTVWVDLVEPTREEQQAAETFAGIDLPTPEEMDEIEPSELLYADNGTRYMTARILCQSKTHRPKLANISFILTSKVLVTVRYDDPKPFETFCQHAQRVGLNGADAEAVFVGLIDAIVARAAEVLRLAGDHVDALSESIFQRAVERDRPRTDEYQQTLTTLGREGARVSKARESMVSIELMLRFASSAGHEKEKEEPQGHIATMLRDIGSLETHTEYLLGKVQFLLDAILGLVNLTQNDIIKILSVIAVVFTPPTFFASMYGMNFKNMPEYDWSLGYPYVLTLMFLSAVLPYLFFRWKKWL